jgi:hypothetical protein
MSGEPRTLLEWAIDNDSLLVFAVRRGEGSSVSRLIEWHLAELDVPRGVEIS